MRIPREAEGRLWIARLTAATLAVGGLCMCFPRVSTQTPSPDTILHGGKIVTVGAPSTAEAVAIDAGRFVAVGRSVDVLKLRRPDTRVIDLEGRTVIPGLSDNHLHNAGGGPGVDLSKTRTLAEVYAQLAARVAKSPMGELVVSNGDWHEAQLREQRLPLRRDLDTIAPNNPVVLVRAATGPSSTPPRCGSTGSTEPRRSRPADNHAL